MMESVHFYGMLIKGLLKFLLKFKIPVVLFACKRYLFG